MFLKANRRTITQPVNCHEYSFKQVKSLAGQGAIYLRLKHGFGFLLDNQGSDNSGLKDNDVSNHTERSMPISTLQPPQRPQEGRNHTQSSPLSILHGSHVSSNHTHKVDLYPPCNQPTDHKQILVIGHFWSLDRAIKSWMQSQSLALPIWKELLQSALASVRKTIFVILWRC